MNTFFKEHLWIAASDFSSFVYVHYLKYKVKVLLVEIALFPFTISR